MRGGQSPLTGRRIQTSLLILIILFLAVWQMPTWRPESHAVAGDSATHTGQQAEPPDSLADLNKAFRDAYSRSRKSLLAGSGPVILVEGDDLVLVRDGKRTSTRVIPDAYHSLKTVSHVPLAIYVMVQFSGADQLGEESLTLLRDYRQRIVDVQKSLKDRGLAEAQLRRLEEILTGSLTFLDDVLKNRRSNSTETTTFTRKIAPLVLASATDAAEFELESLHKQVRSWKAAMTAEDWKKLRVVVMGSALPRRDNLAVQYFARLLREKGEGERIIYAESLFDEGRALNLLGTHLLDSQIGTAFFNDGRRMHRDLLADSAAETIKKMTFDP